ncbi:putative phosphatidate phosphatase [Danaus plexippus]|uniref:putative phosphatidate phosphatase n=1 Tax=Danaus plexippus TaxID=13037 RepID=UPI002AB30D00|nr:putative phosphatidate phosphatase [Danaus plexippus]
MLNKFKYFWGKTNRWHRVFLIFLIVELRIFPGGKYGFKCNDPALSHTFTGDTVSWKLLLLITLTLPLIVMFIVEKTQENSESAKQQALYWYKEYLFGFLLNLTSVQFIKFLVGSPRPHFFDTCRPVEAETCTESQYIYSYQCTNPAWINQSDTSFPSGHSSLAFHSALFIVYYLYQRKTLCKNTLVTQSLCVLLSGYCAVSRLSDHRHHWWDVVAGFVIAIVVLIYTIFHLCGNFKCVMSNKKQILERNEHNECTVEGAT